MIIAKSREHVQKMFVTYFTLVWTVPLFLLSFVQTFQYPSLYQLNIFYDRL